MDLKECVALATSVFVRQDSEFDQNALVTNIGFLCEGREGRRSLIKRGISVRVTVDFYYQLTVRPSQIVSARYLVNH